MKALLQRPVQAVALVFALTLLLALGWLVLSSWSDLQRVEAIRARVNRTHLLQESEMRVKEEQLRLGSGLAPVSAANLDAVRALLAQLPARGGPIGTFTRERLAELDRLLSQARSDPGPALAQAARVLDGMLDRENQIQSALLDSVRDETAHAWRLSLAALIGFPCLVALALWGLRQRVFRPIGDLRAFLARITDGDFAPVPVRSVDPLLQPLFENYNKMVLRLEQFEQSNRARTRSLEEEVRGATGTLLDLQQRLTRAERLAAAGEVAASLAHELRNPIAGIHVTLSNLRREIGDADLSARLDLVIGELQRVTRLLNGLLQQAAQAPEARRDVRVDALVGELVQLLRYQITPQVQLVTQVEPGLHGRLPEDGLRQALLNLVMNGAQAIGAAPGRIEVTARREGTRLRIEVTDDGPGYPAALLANGVRPFASFRDDGTGLGLAIVKRFARDLGGELTLANRTPRGASAVLSLPCA
jgi:C4-dicarboxylate-specific signal transduction histidine kinase